MSYLFGVYGMVALAGLAFASQLAGAPTIKRASAGKVHRPGTQGRCHARQYNDSDGRELAQAAASTSVRDISAKRASEWPRIDALHSNTEGWDIQAKNIARHVQN